MESEPVNAAEGGSEDELELPEDVHEIPALFLGVSHDHCCFQVFFVKALIQKINIHLAW